MSARDKANRVLIHVILILVSITMLVPFLWMILTAFKTMTEATSVNPFVPYARVNQRPGYALSGCPLA